MWAKQDCRWTFERQDLNTWWPRGARGCDRTRVDDTAPENGNREAGAAINVIDNGAATEESLLGGVRCT